MKPKRRPAPTNVRVCQRSRAQLIDLAKRHGITPSNLVRKAIAEKLPEWESKGITLAHPMMPPRHEFDFNNPPAIREEAGVPLFIEARHRTGP